MSKSNDDDDYQFDMLSSKLTSKNNIHIYLIMIYDFYMPLCIIKEPKSYYLMSCITSSFSSIHCVARLADNFIQTTE